MFSAPTLRSCVYLQLLCRSTLGIMKIPSKVALAELSDFRWPVGDLANRESRWNVRRNWRSEQALLGISKDGGFIRGRGDGSAKALRGV